MAKQSMSIFKYADEETTFIIQELGKMIKDRAYRVTQGDPNRPKKLDESYGRLSHGQYQKFESLIRIGARRFDGLDEMVKSLDLELNFEVSPKWKTLT